MFLKNNKLCFLQMSALLWFERKIEGSCSRLWTDERLRYEITEQRRQVAKF